MGNKTSFNNTNVLKIFKIDELNRMNNILISIDLMFIQKNVKTKRFRFIDINKNIINVDINTFLENNPKFFCKNHLYNFKNVLYKGNAIKIIANSKINIIDEDYLFNKDEYISIKDISKIDDNTIINFYSKISSFSLIDNSIQTIEGLNIKFELNKYLIKNISNNGITYFRNFIKKGNKIESTKISYINSLEKTFIQFIFYDYKEENIFNEIIIENNIIKINNVFISYEIKKKAKLRYYAEKIILKGNKNELTFYMYFYKGQINSVVCFINIIGGYYYEFLYQTLDIESLPHYQIISINNNNINITKYDCFQNKFKRRFNILNIEKQKIIREKIIFEENKEDIQINTYTNNFNSWNSWQIFIIIKDKTQYIFSESKIKLTLEKKEFNLESQFEKQLENFYRKYKKVSLLSDYKTDFKTQFGLIFNDKYILKRDKEDSNKGDNKKDKDNLIEDFVSNSSKESIDGNDIENDNENNYNYQDYFQKGFTEYDFKNDKTQYLKIKRLSFLIICKYKDKEELDEEISKLKFIIETSKRKEYIDYIDRIRILLAYVNGLVFDSENSEIKLCFLDNPKYGRILSNAHNFLISIYDKLNEESALYKICSQYNTYIKYNYTVGHHSFTGSLLTINDVKMDLYNLAFPYYFVYYDINYKDWAYFHPNSENVFINLSLFNGFKGYIQNLKGDDAERVSFLMSLVLIHERGGHSKVNEIIDNNSPRYYYLETFKVSIILKKESGYLLETVICPKNLVELLNQYDFPLTLKDVNLFIEPDFQKLNEEIEKENISSDNDDDNNIKNSKKPKKKNQKNKKKKKLSRRYLFFKYNTITQDMAIDDNSFDSEEFQMFLNLEENTKRKKY